MKKMISLLLVMVMVFSIPVFATTVDHAQGTKVVYDASNAESYTVTVPATMAPGETASVSVAGTWASNRQLNVSASEKVTLTNSINAADTKELPVTFAKIALVGDNTTAITADTAGAKADISVAAIENALFGTWSGKITYEVNMTDVA